jgi:hypothetical protein
VASLKTTSLTRDVYVATFGEALLVNFREKTPSSGVVSMRLAAASIKRAHPRFAYFGVIELASDPPDEAARQAFVKFFEDEAAAIATFVIAYRGEGFRGAMIRAIVSQVVNLLPRSRFPFPRQVVGSVQEAALIAGKHAPGIDSAELIDAFERLHAMTSTS